MVMMKKDSLFISVLCVLLLIPGLSIPQTPSVDNLISELQTALDEKDFDTYLSFFSPELRAQEEAVITSLIQQLGLENVRLFKSRFQMSEDRAVRLQIQAFFENSYSAVFETWRLELVRENGRWNITAKSIIGDVSNLYKIIIPSDRGERVSVFEVKHADISLNFRNALVFHDNIPGLETALIVMGDGHLRFTPSLDREQHQLDLLYGKPYLEDRLEYAFLRFSSEFFAKNIKMVRDEANTQPVEQAERNKAYSLFTKHYNRSFTIENSLTDGLLSFLPQGEEAVFAFKGRRIGDFTYVYSPFAEEEISLYQWDEERIINLYSPVENADQKRFFITFGQKFDVRYCEVDIDFEPEKYYLSGRARVVVESKVGGLDAVKLKLHPDLEILRILDEDRQALFYTRDKLRKTLYIYLNHRPSRGHTAEVEIFYRGRVEPPHRTADVIEAGQHEEAYFLIPPRYETYLYSQSSYWYPAPDEKDYFTACLKIIIPPEYTAVASGVLSDRSELKGLERVENLEKEGNSVCVFQTERPIKHLSFIVGKFQLESEETAPVPIRFYRDLDVRAQKRDIVDEAGQIIEFYEPRFGPFPFEELSIIRRLWPTSGGHSPAFFIILNEMSRLRGRERFLSSDSPVNLSRWRGYFLAHEIAHQWWGQGVAWESYQDQWLSEGMAQLAGILYLRQLYGEDAFRDILNKLSRSTTKKSHWGSILMGARISYIDFEAYQAIVYNKSALVLNMLREMLGEEVFFRGLREFFSVHRYGTARTRDFINTMQKISGRRLDGFFKMWFYSYHLPDIKASHRVEKKGETHRLQVSLMQRGEPFVFPLWVEWTEDRTKVRKMVLVEERSQHFIFETPVNPRKVKLDPDKVIPGKID